MTLEDRELAGARGQEKAENLCGRELRGQIVGSGHSHRSGKRVRLQRKPERLCLPPPSSGSHR